MDPVRGPAGTTATQLTFRCGHKVVVSETISEIRQLACMRLKPISIREGIRGCHERSEGRRVAGRRCGMRAQPQIFYPFARLHVMGDSGMRPVCLPHVIADL